MRFESIHVDIHIISRSCQVQSTHPWKFSRGGQDHAIPRHPAPNSGSQTHGWAGQNQPQTGWHLNHRRYVVRTFIWNASKVSNVTSSSTKKLLETHDIMGQCNYEMFAVCIPNSQDVAIGHPKKNNSFHNQGKTGKQILRKGVVSKFEPPKPHGWQYPKAPRPWSMDPSNWTEICKQQLPLAIFLVIEKQPNSKITN